MVIVSRSVLHVSRLSVMVPREATQTSALAFAEFAAAKLAASAISAVTSATPPQIRPSSADDDDDPPPPPPPAGEPEELSSETGLSKDLLSSFLDLDLPIVPGGRTFRKVSRTWPEGGGGARPASWPYWPSSFCLARLSVVDWLDSS